MSAKSIGPQGPALPVHEAIDCVVGIQSRSRLTHALTLLKYEDADVTHVD